MWRSGGIIHLHGGDKPKIVVLGSSHAIHYSKTIDDICKDQGIPVAFLGMPGIPPFFGSPIEFPYLSKEEALEFDQARRNWIREWRPHVVFIIDRWDSRPGGAPEFNIRLRSFLKEVGPLVDRVVFVAQPPVLHIPEGAIPMGFVLWKRSPTTALPRIFPDSREPLRREITALAMAATNDFPELRVLRTDLPFYNPDGSVRYAVGRQFLYRDANHLFDAGAETGRTLFEEAIADVH
jgi:hypothetical protein